MDVSLQEMDPKKLLSKRARKDAIGEGSSAAPQADMKFDGHQFQSEEHQHCFEAIKGWSFLKERRVQLREGEYVEFHEEVSRRQWNSIPMHGPQRRESGISAPGYEDNGSPLNKMPLINS